MSLAIVQAKQSTSGSDPATVTFAGAPTTGNLVINFFYNNSSSANTGQNGWTLLDKLVTGSGTQTIYIHYRYVVGGDGVTYSAPTTDSSDRSQCFQYEISGAGSTWANSFEFKNLETVTSGSTNTSTAHSPSNSTDLMLVAGFDTFIVFPATSTISGGMTLDASLSAQFSIAGNIAHITGTTSSTSLTINWQGSTPGAGTVAFATLVLKVPASGASAAGTMTFGGISFSVTSVAKNAGVGIMSFNGISFVTAASHAETGIGNMHFNGISFVATAAHLRSGVGLMNFSGASFNGQALRVHVSGAGALHFSGVTIHAGGFIPTPAGTGLRQFWTT